VSEIDRGQSILVSQGVLVRSGTRLRTVVAGEHSFGKWTGGERRVDPVGHVGDRTVFGQHQFVGQRPRITLFTNTQIDVVALFELLDHVVGCVPRVVGGQLDDGVTGFVIAVATEQGAPRYE